MKNGIRDKLKDNDEIIFVRTYLLLISFILIGTPTALITFSNTVNNIWAYLITSLLFLLGTFTLYKAILSSEERAVKFANKTGNHEVLLLVIILAYIISNGIKLCLPSPNKTVKRDK